MDNGSTDGGAAVLAGYPGVRVFEESRRGSYSARNRALAEARGDIIAFTDADCLVERDWLEQVAAGLQQPDAGIVLGRRIAAGGGCLRLVEAYESQKTAFVVGDDSGEVVFGHTNCMAVRRGMIDELGPFPELGRGADTVFVRRAVDRFGPAVVQFRPDMRVTHLELSTLRAYYGKSRIYGRSNERLREHVRFRPLTARERWRVFRDTTRAQPRPWLSAPVLLACLLPGLLCYEWGRRIAARAAAARTMRGPTARSAWWRLARPGRLVAVEAPVRLRRGGAARPRGTGGPAAGDGRGGRRHGRVRLRAERDRRPAERTRAPGKTSRASGLTRSQPGGVPRSSPAARPSGSPRLRRRASPRRWSSSAGWRSPSAYSAPPLRLKERGLGRHPRRGDRPVDGARCWPRRRSRRTAGRRPATGALALLGLAIGVRWMALHQLQDVLRDRVGGVRTYAALGGPVFRLILLAFAVELPLLAAVLVLARPQSIAAAIALGAWAVLGSLLRNPLRDLGRRSEPVGHRAARELLLHGPAARDAARMGRAPARRLVARAARRRRRGRPGRSRPPPGPAGGRARRTPRIARPPTRSAPPCASWSRASAPTAGSTSRSAGPRAAGRRGRQVRLRHGAHRADPRVPEGRLPRRAGREARPGVPRGGARAVRPVALLRPRQHHPGGRRRHGVRAARRSGPTRPTRPAIEAILGNRGPDEPVATWFLDPASGPPHGNCVDHAANANVYALLRRRSIDAPELRRYLQDTLDEPALPGRDAVLPVAVLLPLRAGRGRRRARRGGRRAPRARARGAPRRGRSERSPSRPRWPARRSSPAEGATTACEELRDRIRRGQRADGGWPAEALCWGQQGRFWYGSRELTTAFCLEALAAR